MKTNTIIFIIIGIFFSLGVFAQDSLFPSVEEKIHTLECLIKSLEDYALPEKAKIMAKQLEYMKSDSNIINREDYKDFAERINKMMFEISNDQHLYVRYSPEDVLKTKQSSLLSPDIFEPSNYGFQKVEILNDNIGYIRLKEFIDVQYAGNTAEAALSFIKHTNALIIDLRENSGGWGNMVQFLCSYFMECKGENLYEIYKPYINETTKIQCLQYLPQKRYTNKPLYILTSNNTFSAAEIFCDVLQSRERAVIIGETTMGGAHATRGPEVLTDKYILKLPVGIIINSLTNSNWECTGVSPNIYIDSEEALNKAIEEIKTHLRTTE